MAYLSDTIDSATITLLAGLTANTTTIVSCGVDLSGIGTGDGNFCGGVAVGDHTILAANHHSYNTFTFTKQNDTTTTYTATPIANAQVGTTDVQVYQLTTPLPSWVKRFKMLPTNYAIKLGNDTLCLYTRLNQKLYAGECNINAFVPPTKAEIDQSVDAKAWYFSPLTSGDSGFPAGFLLSGEFVVTLHFTNPGLTGPNYPELSTSIQSTMNSLGTGDTLQFVDLSGYQSMGIDINQSFNSLSDGDLTGQGSWLASDVGEHTLGVLSGLVQMETGRFNTQDGNVRTSGMAAFNSANAFTLAFPVMGVTGGAGIDTLTAYIGSENDEFWAPTINLNHSANTVDLDILYDGGTDHTVSGVGTIPTSPTWIAMQWNGTSLKTYYNNTLVNTGTPTTALVTKQLGLFIFRPTSLANVYDSISAIRFYDATPQVTGLGGAGGPASAFLGWDYLPGAQTYKVYSAADGYTTAIATASTNSATINGLAAGTPYTFKVSAVAGGVEGAKSSSVSVTPTAQGSANIANVVWMPGTDPRMGDLSKRARQMKMMRESRE